MSVKKDTKKNNIVEEINLDQIDLDDLKKA
jgi:hypothetical protein